MKNLILLVTAAALLIVPQLPAGNVTDASGAITTGGAAQTALAGITGTQRQRGYLFIQNPATNSDHIYIAFGTAATVAKGIDLAPGIFIKFDAWVPDDSVSIFAATTGDKFILQWAPK